VTEWLLDTGPLVAYLDEGDTHHAWAESVFGALSGPVMTCEPVITEAFHLVYGVGNAQERILAMMEDGAIKITPVLPMEVTALRETLSRYSDRRVDLADACMVRLSELHPRAQLITVDTDFKFYRRHGRQSIPLLAPWKQ
jgi:uncharacterized protein